MNVVKDRVKMYKGISSKGEKECDVERRVRKVNRYL